MVAMYGRPRMSTGGRLEYRHRTRSWRQRTGTRGATRRVAATRNTHFTYTEPRVMRHTRMRALMPPALQVCSGTCTTRSSLCARGSLASLAFGASRSPSRIPVRSTRPRRRSLARTCPSTVGSAPQRAARRSGPSTAPWLAASTSPSTPGSLPPTAGSRTAAPSATAVTPSGSRCRGHARRSTGRTRARGARARCPGACATGRAAKRAARTAWRMRARSTWTSSTPPRGGTWRSGA
mmetsp:Transcript_110265/g.311764  ORF Transcript_110265/g.311764 Transcript_110265/m.311764 type:complete len:236 (+) Transcript_110265:1680-2387(+)